MNALFSKQKLSILAGDSVRYLFEPAKLCDLNVVLLIGVEEKTGMNLPDVWIFSSILIIYISLEISLYI